MAYLRWQGIDYSSLFLVNYHSLKFSADLVVTKGGSVWCLFSDQSLMCNTVLLFARNVTRFGSFLMVGTTKVMVSPFQILPKWIKHYSDVNLCSLEYSGKSALILAVQQRFSHKRMKTTIIIIIYRIYIGIAILPFKYWPNQWSSLYILHEPLAW